MNKENNQYEFYNKGLANLLFQLKPSDFGDDPSDPTKREVLVRYNNLHASSNESLSKNESEFHKFSLHQLISDDLD